LPGRLPTCFSVSMLAAVAQPGGAIPVRSVPRPQAQRGSVLVRIHASGINPLDTKIHAGAAAHARQPLPAILGLDLAGVGGHPGTLAEYAAVDADLLAIKPANLSMREAAALPLVFITAFEGLVDWNTCGAGSTRVCGARHMAPRAAVGRGAIGRRRFVLGKITHDARYSALR
jgi:NADPH2:quinone reductase